MFSRFKRACLCCALLAAIAGCDSDDGPAQPDQGVADSGSPDGPVPDASLPDSASPDSVSPDTAPALPGFGERCTPGGGDGGPAVCQADLTCLVLNGQASADGFCASTCTDSADCPAGAECWFWDAGGTAYCGFLCDGANPSCPNGLGCVMVSGQGAPYVCTGDAPGVCGNGVLESGEDCDGALLDGMTCQAFGFTGGTLGCSGSCAFDTGGCTGTSTCNLPPRDCTAASGCAALEQMLPATGDGYTVWTLPGWAWLRHDTFMLAKYAAAAVACLLPGSWPIGLSDASDSSGGTPKNFDGSLRHPPGTHEKGRDLDVAYYQIGQPDNNPREVCPHLDTNGVEANHCTADPDILDVKRSALFVAKLFESGRVRVVGVDGKIGPLLQAEAEQLNQDGLISDRTLTRLKKRFIWEATDTGMGWYLFHHHHLHLSSVPVWYPGATPSPSTPFGPELTLAPPR